MDKPKEAPYVSNHAIERYMEFVAKRSRTSAVKHIHKAWFAGSIVKKERNGALLVKTSFAVSGADDVDAYLVLSPPKEEHTKHVVRTILRADHYRVLMDLAPRRGPRKKRKHEQKERYKTKYSARAVMREDDRTKEELRSYRR